MATQKALDYNAGRPYAASIWLQIQERVGLRGDDVDGVPGARTAEAVAAWQARHGEPADGMAGPATLSRMGVGPIRILSGNAFCWTGGMSIDADGAPNAYNAGDTGIDFLKNAGPRSSPWGYALDDAGRPAVQGPRDPAPNHYVSVTALADKWRARDDQRRYVDARDVPYIAVPKNIDKLVSAEMVPRPGDLFMAWRAGDDPARAVAGIVADISGSKRLAAGASFGEGSIALAERLGHDPYVRRDGLWRAARGIAGGICYLVLPHRMPAGFHGGEAAARVAAEVIRDHPGLLSMARAALGA